MVFTSLKNPDSRLPDEEKYPALRTILVIWKVLVVVQLLVLVVLVVAVWKTTNPPNAAAIGLLSIASGLVFALVQWAAAELVEVLMDIEENTRRMAQRT